MNARLWHDSEREKPTQTRSYPVRQESEPLQAQRDDAPLKTNPEAKPKRVLVVDDEKVIADTLAMILCQAGYEAAAVYDGSSALVQCESFRPELIIADVVMPKTNGIRMAMLVKQRYPDCRILLFSGQAATLDFLEEARQGGYDFEVLPKPVHPKDLLAKLAR